MLEVGNKELLQKLIVTGIGTDIGKTVVSAILTQALKASYWKPIQAGELDNSDSIKVKQWCDNTVSILPEFVRLKNPLSPHIASEMEGIQLSLSNFSIPEVNQNLIIESAGGLMVPINNEGLLFIDLIEKWNLPVILVSKHYLGSINHTLLSAEVLKNKNIKVEGIIFVGDENKATESIILKKTGFNCITRIPLVEEINPTFIQQEAKKIIHFFETSSTTIL